MTIPDAVWVNPNPIESGSSCGPPTAYEVASFTNVIGAGQDPVAPEHWAANHILIPAAIQRSYTSYLSLDPDYVPVTLELTESYHTYLEISMNELKNAGYELTMNETEMNVYIFPPFLRTDLNSDGAVDIDGLSIVAGAFGTYTGHPRWNETADINKDGRVNINDVTIVTKDYGKRV